MTEFFINVVYCWEQLKNKVISAKNLHLKCKLHSGACTAMHVQLHVLSKELLSGETLHNTRIIWLPFFFMIMIVVKQ